MMELCAAIDLKDATRVVAADRDLAAAVDGDCPGARRQFELPLGQRDRGAVQAGIEGDGVR